ncbi:MAG: DsbA family protein [Betaproteobacteria bacterium]
MLNLVYFADPMCSWCYGFGPQLETVIDHETARQQVKLDLTMGGLRAYNDKVMDDESRAAILEHWQHVGEATGLPFNDAAIRSEGFVYDTEPACRAVVAVRQLDSALALRFYHAVQRAFYADGRDVTQESVLAEVAVATGIDGTRFVEAFRSTVIRDATREDFGLTQSVGVTGFPTLAVDIDQRLYLITAGFSRAEAIEAGLARLAAEPPTA